MAKKPSTRRFKVARLVVVLVAIAAFGAGAFFLHKYQVQRHAGELLVRAEAAGTEHNWTAAAALYQSYLNFRPKDADAVVKYLSVLEELNKTDPGTVAKLTGVYERLMSIDPERTDERRKLVGHYITVQRYAAAREHLRQLMSDPKIGPDDPDLNDLYALCDEKDRKFPDAIARLTKLVRGGHAGPEAHLRLALMLHFEAPTEESPEEAKRLLDQLVAANPEDVKVRLARAKFRRLTDGAERAWPDVEHAYKRSPGGKENADVAIALADVAGTAEQLSLAKEALEGASHAAPADTRLALILADVLIRTNDVAAAKRALAAAAKAATTASEASASRPDLTLIEVADRLLDLGDTEAARSVAEQCAKDAKTKFFADYLVGRVRLAEGNWPAAVALLRQAIVPKSGLEKFPVRAFKAQLALADCYTRANNPDLRLRAFQTALTYDQNNVFARLGAAESLLRTGNIKGAIAIYQPLAATVPAARLALAQLRLNEQLALPEKDRSWAAVEGAIGPDPLTPDLAVLKANMLMYRGNPTAADALLDATVKRAPTDAAPWVALAAVRGAASPEAGLKVIDEAEGKVASPRVEFLLTRAQFLARSSPPDLKGLAAIADESKVGSLKKPDRARLLYDLGVLYAGLGKTAEAVAVLKRSADEGPYDLAPRILLFDLALQTKDVPLQDKILSELDVLDGPDGPYRVVAELTRALPATKPGDTAHIASLRARATTAQSQRETWGRVHVILGDLDLLEGNPDAALDQYRRALELGERDINLVRNATSLLVERQGHAEALELLTRTARSGPMPADMLKQLTLLRAEFGEESERTLGWARSEAAAGSKDYRDQLARYHVFAANNARPDALKAVEQALVLNETAPEVWVELVRIQVGGGAKADAETAAERAEEKLKPVLEKPETRPVAELALGVCRELLGDMAGAEKWYRSAVKDRPTDPDTVRRLLVLFQRTGRAKEAESLLDGLIKPGNPPATQRWARRVLAFSQIGGPDGYARLGSAVELVDQNLRDGNDQLDDRRAKAIILAADPFKQSEAIELLVDSARKLPLSPEQNYLLARLYRLQEKLPQAETALRAATRAAAVAVPEHLALLVRVQLEGGNGTGAAETIRRLKLVAPAAWETTVEEARALAANGKTDQAVAIVTAAPGNDATAALVSRVGPLLEEIGCKDAAAKVYERVAKTGGQPNSHAPLVGYLIRSHKYAEAAALAFAHEKTAPVGLTARLLAADARSHPPETLPQADRAAWRETTVKIDNWIADKLKADPANATLRLARADLDDVLGRFDDEIKAYEAALATDPNNDGILNNLAMLLAVHAKDGSDRPLKTINRAIALKGPRPSFLDTRAVVHIAARHYDLAINDLAAAIAQDRKPAYYFHLAQAYQAQGADDKPDLADLRDKALAQAKVRGLTKAMLHPKEWGEYDKLVGAQGGR
ncbi:tetratricopeptide repeat protein [Fimbriiglobus ruber]|uniref:Flagellar hook-length control protein FliK n=1 Tax=Fimbriiglobus ruber TaxID=1908690 RepID=A0A225EGM6_9BACT|nr:tetratricopeptide repeat protein [Fimbriiglobus ruber]OWK47367.1 Flagellar hook-length control protein FliK [Fimbriiglobus ruber]